MDQFGYYYQNSKPTNSKVHINRNFNRVGPDRALTNSNMYFNPNFTKAANLHHNNQQDGNQLLRPRIHFNPNFIKPKSQQSCSVDSFQMNSVVGIPRPISACYPLENTLQTQPVYEYGQNPQMETISKSRYCLVRQKEIKVIKSPLADKLLISNTQQTVKVNKYKSVSLNSVKKSLATSKSPGNKINEPPLYQSNLSKTMSKYRIVSKPISNNVQNTRFKFIKQNYTTKLPPDTKQGTVRRVSITLNKSIHKSRQTKKNMRGAMKKNNIPCPLFKKYGKCLRLIQGRCDYLHDKKHVSICRKFMAGICHDKQCLLSHDLTDKKMPTCYFYLQGICTKEECPYLHVKLNEKTKICSEFLKGYCEKGHQCLHRHVSPDTATKTKDRSSYTQRNHNESIKIFKKNSVKKKENTTPIKEVTINQSGEDAAKDQRYFREADNTSPDEQCNLIKPIRCKLGTLPSYIQL